MKSLQTLMMVFTLMLFSFAWPVSASNYCWDDICQGRPTNCDLDFDSIKDQRIDADEQFDVFDLDNYVDDKSWSQVTFTHSQHPGIFIDVDPHNRVYVTPHSGFYGSADIVFYAWNICGEQKTQTVTFTVRDRDDRHDRWDSNSRWNKDRYRYGEFCDSRHCVNVVPPTSPYGAQPYLNVPGQFGNAYDPYATIPWMNHYGGYMQGNPQGYPQGYSQGYPYGNVGYNTYRGGSEPYGTNYNELSLYQYDGFAQGGSSGYNYNTLQFSGNLFANAVWPDTFFVDRQRAIEAWSNQAPYYEPAYLVGPQAISPISQFGGYPSIGPSYQNAEAWQPQVSQQEIMSAPRTVVVNPRLVSVAIAPSTQIYAGETFTITTDIKSGSETFGPAVIDIRIPSLNVQERHTLPNLNALESWMDRSTLSIPACLPSQDVELQILIEYAGTKQLSHSIQLHLLESPCALAQNGDELMVEIYDKSDVPVGGRATYPVRLVNFGLDAKSYYVSTSGLEEFGWSLFEPSAHVIVEAGQTKEVFLQVYANKDARPGLHSFTLTIQSGKEQKSVILDAMIYAPQNAVTHMHWIRIGLIMVLVVCVLSILYLLSWRTPRASSYSKK